jgi:hypothetical protein
LALTLLAAQTPGDVEVEYIEVSDLKQADAFRTDFDLVGLSSYTAMAYEMYALADRYREAGVPVVLGGLHVFHKTRSMDPCDARPLPGPHRARRRMLRRRRS